MIQFHDVSKKFGNSISVLDKINFSVDKGEFIFLIGPTGSGKTTIFRLIIRDLLPTEGKILISNIDLTNIPKNRIPKYRRKVGVVFQDLKLLMDRTVMENILLPLQMSNVREKEAIDKALELLISTNLENKKDQFPLQLSGGERQRVAIARALVFDPEIILADEPTGNLDQETSLQILNLLENINKKGTTVFMATHNDKIIEKTDKRVILIDKGKITEKKQKKEDKDAP